jgi:hypothetical protein
MELRAREMSGVGDAGVEVGDRSVEPGVRLATLVRIRG